MPANSIGTNNERCGEQHATTTLVPIERQAVRACSKHRRQPPDDEGKRRHHHGL
jgi:hypothetical protein